MQEPAATSDRAEPLTVQTEGVLDENVTASPDDAVALRAGAATPRVWLAGWANVMVCAAFTTGAITVKLPEAGTAAAKLLLPGWFATMVQVPAASKVSAVLFTVHTEVVPDVKVTAKPEDAVAARAGGTPPIV